MPSDAIAETAGTGPTIAGAGTEPLRRGTVLHTRVATETGGGPDKTILNSPRYLQPFGFPTSCAYLCPPGDPGTEVLRDRAESLSAVLEVVPDRGAWDLSVVGKLLTICRRENVTVWHAHDYKTNALGLLLRPFHPMTLVTTVHGWVRHTKRTPLYYWIDRRCLPYYDHVFAVSPDLLETARRAGVSEARSSHLPNAIDTDQFRPPEDKAAAKIRLGRSPDRPLVGAVGRFSAEKDFGRLIDAASRLLDDGLDFDLVILGDGDEREALLDRVAASPRRDRIDLPGFVAETRPYYEAMDLFVLSSLREGLPNVVLEAMATGVHVVATNVAGVPDLIRDGSTGLLVPPGDTDALAASMALSLNSAETSARHAAAARRDIETRFSFAERMRQIRSVYDRLIDPDVSAEAVEASPPRATHSHGKA